MATERGWMQNAFLSTEPPTTPTPASALGQPEVLASIACTPRSVFTAVADWGSDLGPLLSQP